MRSQFRRVVANGIVLTLGLGVAQATLGHDDAPHVKAQGEPKAPAQARASEGDMRDARSYFTDLELVTQDGRKVRFYSDMLAGRTVLINVIYTSCKDACPLITQRLNQVRDLVGDRFGRSVHFVTLTSDPERDAPAALKAFAQREGVDLSGWTFLTGNKQNVDKVLMKLGAFSQDVEDHTTVLLAGNVPAKRWAKIRPDAAPLLIAERLKVLASSGAASDRVD